MHIMGVQFLDKRMWVVGHTWTLLRAHVHINYYTNLDRNLQDLNRERHFKTMGKKYVHYGVSL